MGIKDLASANELLVGGFREDDQGKTQAKPCGPNPIRAGVLVRLVPLCPARPSRLRDRARERTGR